MICEKCKADISDTAKFCPKCGASATVETTESPKDVKICPKCGTPNPLTAKFCKKDGVPLKEEIRPIETKETEVKPEIFAESKKEEVTVEEKQEEKPPEKVLEVEEPKDVILCPKCGTPNSLTAKFCKKDGALLKVELEPLEIKETIIQPETSVKPEVKEETVSSAIAIEKEAYKKPMKVWVWVAVLGIILLIAGGGSYLYFSGFIGKNPSKVQDKINVELKEKGIINVYAEVDKDWVATIGGSVSNQSYKDEALGIVKKHEEIKDVVDNIQIQSPISDIERDINKALKDEGLTGIYAQVDNDLIVTLKGSLNSQDEKDKAINIARMNKEIKDLRDDIQISVTEPEPAPIPSPAPVPAPAPAPTIQPSQPRIDPAALEGEINRAMRNSGLRGVKAEVGDDLSVTLKGSVRSAFEKDRAFEIAKTFKDKGVRRIRDVIFVVE